MKDNFFEMLLSLFEKTLSQLREHSDASKQASGSSDEAPDTRAEVTLVQAASDQSVRIFTEDEQRKLTKASYQFLMRLSSWGILASDVLELIINQLIFSESRFVSLQETKWTIRHTLAKGLGTEQLAFLDLVLYHKEDELPRH